MEELIQSVEKVTESINTSVSGSTTAIQVLEVLQKNLESYAHVTSNFFAVRMDKVKGIYESIRFNRFPYNKISSYDVNYTIYSYEDYVDGLIEFVMRVVSLNNDDDVEVANVVNTINSVKEKDKEFIKSMHGGELSPVSEMDLDTAMKNVEAITRLDGNFTNILAKCHELCEVATHESRYNEVALEASKLLVNSICTHYSMSINEIATTYGKIIDSMKHRTPVNGVKEVKTYQLF